MKKTRVQTHIREGVIIPAHDREVKEGEEPLAVQIKRAKADKEKSKALFGS